MLWQPAKFLIKKCNKLNRSSPLLPPPLPPPRPLDWHKFIVYRVFNPQSNQGEKTVTTFYGSRVGETTKVKRKSICTWIAFVVGKGLCFKGHTRPRPGQLPHHTQSRVLQCMSVCGCVQLKPRAEEEPPTLVCCSASHSSSSWDLSSAAEEQATCGHRLSSVCLNCLPGWVGGDGISAANGTLQSP